jgi:hypothetical protein
MASDGGNSEVLSFIATPECERIKLASAPFTWALSANRWTDSIVSMEPAHAVDMQTNSEAAPAAMSTLRLDIAIPPLVC